MTSEAPTTKTKRERLVWVDCEMTGLDPDKDTLLEVAAIVTEGDLSTVADGPNLGWSPSYLTSYNAYENYVLNESEHSHIAHRWKTILKSS